MRYKKTIVIICLLTFLFLPYQKPKANETSAVIGSIVSSGLATLSTSAITPALMGIAIGFGVYYVGYNVHKF